VVLRDNIGSEVKETLERHELGSEQRAASRKYCGKFALRNCYNHIISREVYLEESPHHVGVGFRHVVLVENDISRDFGKVYVGYASCPTLILVHVC
jgi:hypothetical protein